MNGDVLTDLDLADLPQRHEASGAPLTVAMASRSVRVDSGVLDPLAGQIVGFTEKPALRYQVSMGVYGRCRRTLDPYPAGLSFGFDELIFIGGHVSRALRQNSRVSELRTPGRDVCDLVASGADELAELPRAGRPGVVVNCTGRLSGAAHDLIQANTAVTSNLIEAIARVAPGTRLVRLGSAAEYGVVREPRAVAEDHPARPVSAYGRPAADPDGPTVHMRPTTPDLPTLIGDPEC